MNIPSFLTVLLFVVFASPCLYAQNLWDWNYGNPWTPYTVNVLINVASPNFPTYSQLYGFHANLEFYDIVAAQNQAQAENLFMMNLWSANVSAAFRYNATVPMQTSCVGCSKAYLYSYSRNSLDREPVLAGTLANSPEIGGSPARIAQARALETADGARTTLYNRIVSSLVSPSPGEIRQAIAQSNYVLDRTWYKGYYGGLQSSFISQGLNIYSQALPAGPLQAWCGVNNVPYNFHAADRLYASSPTFTITLPYERSIEALKAGGVTGLFLMGFRANPMLRGTAADLAEALKNIPYINGVTVGQVFERGEAAGMYLPGQASVILTDAAGNDIVDGTTAHELVHSAFGFFAKMPVTIMDNVFSVESLEARGYSANEIVALRNQAFETLRFSQSVSQGSTVAAVEAGINPNLNLDYFSDSELLAFIGEGCDSCLVGALVDYTSLKPSEVAATADLLMRSPTLNYYINRSNELVSSMNEQVLSDLIESVGY